MLFDKLTYAAPPEGQRTILHALGMLTQSPTAGIKEQAVSTFLRVAKWSKEAKPSLFTDAERRTLAPEVQEYLAGK